MNQICPSINGGKVEYMSTVPLSGHKKPLSSGFMPIFSIVRSKVEEFRSNVPTLVFQIEIRLKISLFYRDVFVEGNCSNQCLTGLPTKD